jgi:predicted ATP-binding protein involved in virulence
LHIESLYLSNFRRFEDATFEFAPGFNLLVGENGAGKSSVLLAILASLGELPNILAGEVQSFFKPEHIRLQRETIRNVVTYEKQYPFTIRSIYIWEKMHSGDHDKFSESSQIDNAASKLVRTDNLRSIVQKLVESEQNHKSNDATKWQTYPLAIYFPIEKSNYAGGEPIDPSLAATIKSSRFFAYSSALNTNNYFFDLQNWIIGKVLERLQDGVLPHDNAHSDELRIVQTTLSSCVEKFGWLHFNIKERRLSVEWSDGTATPFNYLSDGQRGLIAMVADIARRACLLNPHLGDKVLEETPGIILIDELDLHLHPKWQRRIVKNLKDTFPKMQFIATTHSPQIIGECKPEEIIIVTETGGRHPSQSFGMDSNSVLRAIMGSPDRDTEIAALLDQLFSEIDDHKFDEARETLKTLREKKAGDLYEITEAEHTLRRFDGAHDEAAE